MIEVIHGGDTALRDEKGIHIFMRPGERRRVPEITDAMRRVGIRAVRPTDTARLAELDHEQAKVEVDALAERFKAAQTEIAQRDGEIARLRSQIRDFVKADERFSEFAQKLEREASEAKAALAAAEDRIRTGSVVERPWAKLSDDGLLEWVNSVKGGKAFSGKGAIERATAWAFTQGDLTLFEMWAERPLVNSAVGDGES